MCLLVEFSYGVFVGKIRNSLLEKQSNGENTVPREVQHLLVVSRIFNANC